VTNWDKSIVDAVSETNVGDGVGSNAMTDAMTDAILGAGLGKSMPYGSTIDLVIIPKPNPLKNKMLAKTQMCHIRGRRALFA
jgi:hypothetical protein